MFQLKDYQIEAINKMHNGCILCGDVGSGKSLTSLSYYYSVCNGRIGYDQTCTPMKTPLPLYIITTARKRDSKEWEGELTHFIMGDTPVVIDSWNNIKKYQDVTNSFFIFDEQRVVGWGAWSKAFVKIAKSNRWILLSATPGDSYIDYAPVFIANGYFKNITEFRREHVIYKAHYNFPKIDRYVGIERLNRLRARTLVNMRYKHDIEKVRNWVHCDYDKDLYKTVMKLRQNPYKDFEPIQNSSEFCYTLRKITNSDSHRLFALHNILINHKKVIVFYNFDYEREALLGYFSDKDVTVAEWSGHAHQDVPTTDNWIYLVQYNSGSEAWNCIVTNVIVFYSLNYSYKLTHQAAGRIDRMNTLFDTLYYYYFDSYAPIDMAIRKALRDKKTFNENKFVSGF